MFATLKGICHLCREDKPIPILRDSYGICTKCNRQIQADVENFNTIQCNICGKQFSPLWGEISNNGNFQCRNCLPEGICGFCRQLKRLPFVGQDENGYFLFCRDCQAEGDDGYVN